MNWLTLTLQHLTRKISLKFLIVFSILFVSAAGVLWACGGYEQEDYSIFSPEYFVDKQYRPFFYDSSNVYYKDNTGEDSIAGTEADPIVTEWFDHLDHKISRGQLSYLLFDANAAALDSVYHHLNGNISLLPATYPAFAKGAVNKKQLQNMFKYLSLAKACERFANQPITPAWETPVDTVAVPAALHAELTSAFDKLKDPFIKQRLWFQLVRAAYFDDRVNHPADSLSLQAVEQSRVYSLFHQHEGKFPKNLIYYKTLGYVAGYYYRHKQFGYSNYMYSLCYNYTSTLKMRSKWSFHPQEEADWKQALALAKNNEEKATLWQMIGIENDPGRAIKEIAALNPHSDKMLLLLLRLINIAENEGPQIKVDADSLKYETKFAFNQSAAEKVNVENNAAYNAAYSKAYKLAIKQSIATNADLRLIDSLASSKSVLQPYLWDMAAGYLHYLHYDYEGAAKRYASAKAALPANKEIVAQYKLLEILLSVHQLNRIDSKVESRLIEPLTWLANLRDQKDTIANLRFDAALTGTVAAIADIYNEQGNKVKATFFNNSSPSFYEDYNNVDSVINLINKSEKSAFEQVMLRFYPEGVEQLYYQQALIMTYKENTDQAITLMEKAGDIKSAELYGNPFTSRLIDCHDCDHAAPQKRKFTFIGFLKTVQTLKNNLKQRKDAYQNAWLLANAYYNINYYGNARLFYEGHLLARNWGSDQYSEDETAVTDIYVSQRLPKKYYLLALQLAVNNEQRARCTFMLSKCEQNDFYNNEGKTPLAHIYFKALKSKYAQTKYYQDVLKECGYFNTFLSAK